MSLRFSIVTACLNRAGMIESAVESVRAQAWPNVEHIVVDGGSTDGTLDILAQYPELRVFSGPDSGVFDAWNKGLARITGDVVCILNSDDLLAPGTLARVAAAFAGAPQTEVVSGSAFNFVEQPDGAWQVVYEHRESPGSTLDVERMAIWGPCVNARFFRRATIERHLPFNLAYPLGADNDFMLRVAHARPVAAYLEDFVYCYRTHAGSLSMDPDQRNLARGTRATLDVVEKFLSRNDLSPPERRHALEHHAIRVAANSISLANRGSFGDACRILVRGLVFNPWLLLTLLRRRRRVSGEISRKVSAPAYFKPLERAANVGR